MKTNHILSIIIVLLFNTYLNAQTNTDIFHQIDNQQYTKQINHNHRNYNSNILESNSNNTKDNTTLFNNNQTPYTSHNSQCDNEKPSIQYAFPRDPQMPSKTQSSPIDGEFTLLATVLLYIIYKIRKKLKLDREQYK